MCGITAINRATGKTSIHRPDQMARLGAIAIEDRGRDATGFAWTDADDQSWYWKQATRASEIVHRAPLNATMSTIIGHTRWKTQGPATVNANNHPVVDDGIMLVHNGIINNDWSLYRELGLDFVKKAEVDSQVIASLLSHLPAEHPTDILEMLKGSASVAWIATAQPHTLHLARVKERPLTIAWTRSGDLVMSSTPQTLEKMSILSGTRFRHIREIDEGVYLRVIGGEIVEEKHFVVPANHQTYATGWTGTVVNHPKAPTVQNDAAPPLVVVNNTVPPADYDWFDDTTAYLKHVYDEAMAAYTNGTISLHQVIRCQEDYEESLAYDERQARDRKRESIEARVINSGPLTDEELDICRMTEDQYDDYHDYKYDLASLVFSNEMTQDEMDRLLAEDRNKIARENTKLTMSLALPRGDWEYPSDFMEGID